MTRTTEQIQAMANSEDFEVLHRRAELYRLVRDFLAERNVVEVHTPILSAAGNTEPNIESFVTDFHGPGRAGPGRRYLRTSPEYPLKRLLAAGFGDCYELGRVFRDGEAGRRHNPEFDMLEWYRVGFDHRRLMLESIELVRAAMALVDRPAKVRVVSYRDLYREALDLDPMQADAERLRAPLADYGIDPAGLERDDWLDLLMTHCLQPAMPASCITAVYDYPASQCMLARLRPGPVPVAERFELFLGSRELANGYHELADADEQRARFEQENARREARGQPRMPIDDKLLAVLDELPDCAGVALGVERLLMAMTDADDIAEVMAFPFLHA
ncbi:MAG: EF-P lysine aminoacylase EpmA [Rhodanobacteraceae bacterium]